MFNFTLIANQGLNAFVWLNFQLKSAPCDWSADSLVRMSATARKKVAIAARGSKSRLVRHGRYSHSLVADKAVRAPVVTRSVSYTFQLLIRL